MDEFDDYPVEPRSDDALESIADEIRKRLGMSVHEVLPASEMLGRLRDRYGVEIVVRPDAEMGRKEAYTTSNPSRMFFREFTFRAIEKNEPRGRMTVAHEAIHFFLHPGAPKARAADGNKTPDFIKPYASAERQARVGAAALLMPRQLLALAASARELQVKCNVSLEAAEIRFNQWRRKTKGRPELPFVRAHLDRLKSLDSAAGRRGESGQAEGRPLSMAIPGRD